MQSPSSLSSPRLMAPIVAACWVRWHHIDLVICRVYERDGRGRWPFRWGGRGPTVSAMGPVGQHRATGAPVAPAVGRGIVSRRALLDILGNAGRVTVVSAPPGSGKTLLLRSWIAEPGVAEHAAWVAVQPEERDPERFWVSVADALRGTAVGSALVRPLTAAPDVDGWAVVERLLADLGSLEERVWLVVDDLHVLSSAEALRQLELLVLRAPPELRFVLATRHDVRLGLHRLRLGGELTEIRGDGLGFRLEGRRPGWGLRTRLSRCCTGGPRAGRRGCGWPPCRWPGTRTRTGSRPSSAEVSGRWPSTCWPRCWSGRASRYGGCCCGPRWPSGSAASWLTCWPGPAGAGGGWRGGDRGKGSVVPLAPRGACCRGHRW